MMPSCRDRRPADRALSEVIGFVLILGVLVLVFSLYLTYGIPAQGRENEILHMNEVKDQFVAYKISLDSLFNNNKVGTTLGSSFYLGTGGGYTQGMVSFIPIMNPVSSGGIIAINQRTPVHETLNISSHSLVLNDTYRMSVHFGEGVPLVPNYPPDHLYVNISGVQPVDLGPSGTFGANITGRDWVAYINITPRLTYYQNYTLNPPPMAGGQYTLSLVDAYNYNRSDIAISVKKGGVPILQDFTVYTNISSNTVYPVDLMDEAYGLKTLIRPHEMVNLSVGKPLNAVSASGNATYDFVDMNPYTITPIALGSIEYRAQNNYWIPQDYYYQMGGVFLSQAEGNVSYKLPPEISFTNDSARNLISVNINALSFNPDNRGLIGGNSPVQVRTKLESVYPIPYVKGDEITGNTKRVWIGVNTSDPKANAMWESFFDSTAKGSGIPAGEYNVSRVRNESYIEIFGPSADPDVNDIRLTVTNATYSTWVHGVGGVYE
ncbi:MULTISPECIES: hypothetical protein [unclassified Methanoregula]|uniref:hypothetical protein n=1 Tax=unclassified Methanoregula TaxID=2649730 RepID=UPI0009CD6B5F|nr:MULTISPECIES: hypothetical protein [unclassified Methanoregula]OPX64949.1 MAG: hypothetical protein A4E33_00687 [Methanoregula sp. PtaB.Bin085]OPY33001.1 MAG: hypothetical protein A4E34_02378 [Methanoregula sp. PtaU1.Bin006]